MIQHMKWAGPGDVTTVCFLEYVGTLGGLQVSFPSSAHSYYGNILCDRFGRDIYHNSG